MIPSLTTVAQPIYEMGAHAARLLLEHIAEPETAAHETVQFETRLMVRDSSVRLQEEKR
jgi:LacI family transcriptional regulator